MTIGYTRLKFLVFYCLCGWWLHSCNIVNPVEQVPTYIHIDSFAFKNTLGGGHTTTHNINSAWVYYNGVAIGEYDLPATIPVIASGYGKLQVAPAIAVNGQNNLEGVYPFYTYDSFTFAAQPGKIITHVPVTGFSTGTTVTIIDAFETGIKGGGTNFYLADGNIGIVTTDSLKEEGEGSGGIYLKAVGDSSTDSSIKRIIIPQGTAFIELDYKGTLQVAFGLSAYINSAGIGTTSSYIAGILPSEKWEKFYLNVANFTAQYKGDSYTFYIKTSLQPGQTSGYALFDNIQLVTPTQ